jgi:hypothetical protein
LTPARTFAVFALLAASAVGSSGCKRGADTLNVFFRDDVVAAPARTVDLVAYMGTDCDPILSQRHDDEATASKSNVLARKNTRFPVNPGANVLDGLPRGMPFAIDVATYDRDQVLMGRGCQVVTLHPGMTDKIDIEMHALPSCKMGPQTLDVGVVLDISQEISAADPTNIHLTEFDQHIMQAAARFAAPASWTVITDDDKDGPKELVPQTTDTGAVKAALAALPMTQMTMSRAYDGVTLMGKKLRARAVCGVRPMLIVILGDAEQNPAPGARDEALVEIVSTRGYPPDNIFTYGLALSDPAYDELNSLIPPDVGTAATALGDTQIRMQMNDVGTMLRGLIQ